MYEVFPKFHKNFSTEFLRYFSFITFSNILPNKSYLESFIEGLYFSKESPESIKNH